MKKRVLTISLILLIMLFILPLVVLAQDDETNADESALQGVEKAYSCLESRLGDNCGNSASTEETTLSLLAGAYKSSVKSDCKDSLINKKKEDNCWGATISGACDLKSTSQAILALNYIGENTDDYVEWILNKKKQTTDLDWFLEIDANEATSCKIKINEASENTFAINENKKVSGTSSCLTSAEGGYFLKISETCYNANFSISCDKDFISTLLYKKQGSSVYYVSSKTHSASAEGTTKESVNSFCFSTSSSCDYQGSLWASLALGKTVNDISPYMPYLTSMYDESDNKKYFPSAFLLMLTNEDDYYIDVKDKQKQGKYWEEDNNKFYDTALALLSLENYIIDEVANAKDYLLEIQDDSGCWHSDNIKDTAFILYAAWPKQPAISAGRGDGRSDCKDFNFFCISPVECDFENTADNFDCPGLSDVCCKVEPEELTCEERDGIECEEGHECTSLTVSTSDSYDCCLDSCVEVDTETECEKQGYVCKSSCSDDEDEEFYDCNYGDSCCNEKQKESGSWWWIILLVILIILVILAIIFRNQLKIWFFKIKNKVKSGKPPKPSNRPNLMPPTTPHLLRRPMPGQRMPYRRPLARGPEQGRPVPGRPPMPKPQDKDFDDTMKKLREMSK